MTTPRVEREPSKWCVRYEKKEFFYGGWYKRDDVCEDYPQACRTAMALGKNKALYRNIEIIPFYAGIKRERL